MSEIRLTATRLQETIQREFPNANAAEIIFSNLMCACAACENNGVDFVDMLEMTKRLFQEHRNDTNNNSNSSISGSNYDRPNS